jgi:hypothetical protein
MRLLTGLQRGNTYRYFLTASQLLNDIKANPLNLGGVLFWDKRFHTHPPIHQLTPHTTCSRPTIYSVMRRCKFDACVPADPSSLSPSSLRQCPLHTPGCRHNSLDSQSGGDHGNHPCFLLFFVTFLNVLIFNTYITCIYIYIHIFQYYLYPYTDFQKASSRRRDTGKRVQHIDDAERSSHHPFMSKEALHGLRKNRDTEPARSSAPPSSSSAPPGGGSGNASPGPGDKGGQRASSSSSIPTQRAVRLPELLLPLLLRPRRPLLW